MKIKDSLNFNISETSWGMKLNFCMSLDIHRCNKYAQYFQVGVARYEWAYLKLSQIVSQLHHLKWFWSGMLKMIYNNELVLSQK